MLLARKTQKIGEIRRYQVSYKSWLDDCVEEKLTNMFISSAPTDVAVSGVLLSTNKEYITFMVNSTVAPAGTYVLTLTAFTNRDQTKIDTMEIVVEAV
jgi:hypothetical protein